jgi:8-oxo-dGTP pyrophosphatase MutT (NUDIX family)
MTLGARVAVIDDQDRVLLVKQTYDPRWILPGGGVDRGETIQQAAIRELHEEASVRATGKLHFHGFFSNHHSFPGDHIACFIVRDYTQDNWQAGAEISAAEFFPVSRLPSEMNIGSRRRITEISRGLPPDPHW